jgi:uncharacterized membrane protein YgdD (TMEM256/DUF423 family)
MESTFTALAAIFGFLSVALGAFGAHSLERYFEQHPGREGTFKTGVQYHQIHALALLGVAWASGRWSSGLIPAAGYLFALGILLFSGSLYLLSVTNRRWLGAITPLGGLAFLAGWACLLIGSLQR